MGTRRVHPGPPRTRRAAVVDYLNHVAAKNGCEILVVNQESLSPQQEMVEDLLSIVHSFSCRLYGLWRYEKTLKDELSGEVTG